MQLNLCLIARTGIKKDNRGSANYLAARLEDGQPTQKQEHGLVGEAGRSITGSFYSQDLEALLIKEDLDKGQNPFYNYEYDTGKVIHNGQVTYYGQSIADAERILRKKFNP